MSWISKYRLWHHKELAILGYTDGWERRCLNNTLCWDFYDNIDIVLSYFNHFCLDIRYYDENILRNMKAFLDTWVNRKYINLKESFVAIDKDQAIRGYHARKTSLTNFSMNLIGSEIQLKSPSLNMILGLWWIVPEDLAGEVCSPPEQRRCVAHASEFPFVPDWVGVAGRI